jgi:Zn-finger protein
MKQCTTNPCPYKEPNCSTCEFYKEVTEELIVYTNGVCHCSVCTNIKSLKRIEELVNQKNFTGIENKWKFDRTPYFAQGQPNPCPCEQKPLTHKHYLMVC